MSYKVNSPIDSVNIVRTVIITGLVLSCTIPAFISSIIAGVAILTPFSALMFFIYAGIPKEILVTDNEVILRNLFRKRIISRSAIVCVKEFTREDRQGLRRLFGSEGLFGYCGQFATKTHPLLHIYASQNKTGF